MKKIYKGSLTIFLALAMSGFMLLCLVLIEGIRIYYLRAEAERAMELAGFSVLAEYQQELFEHYGVFFLEMDYEQGKESTAILESRLQKYLSLNADEITTKKLTAAKFQRAADGNGTAFFKQAVEQTKIENGYKTIELLMETAGDLTEDVIDIGGLLNKAKSSANGIISKFLETAEDIIPDISLPSVSLPSMGLLMENVLGGTEGLSKKSVELNDRLMKRSLAEGVGSEDTAGLLDMQMFHAYIFNHCGHYLLEDGNVWNEELAYQIEYIIAGKDSDVKNLESVMWKIFLLRVSGDYLFYHQDPKMIAKTKADALAVVGFTGNAALISLVQEIFLISQAIEDGISETKQIFAGKKVPLYEKGILQRTDMGYEEYLYMFLNTTGKEKKIYRCMDIVELEVRHKSGYEDFRLDHCTDAFEVEWNYQFESIFQMVPFGGMDIYEQTITRKVFYEM